MRLNDIGKKYATQVNFLCVYIKEAHPTDGNHSPYNVADGILYQTPTTADARADIAGACMLRYNFSFPMVLDDMSDRVEAAYAAMPERLYVLDREGRVAWKCGLVPPSFEASDFEVEIKAAIADEV